MTIILMHSGDPQGVQKVVLCFVLAGAHCCQGTHRELDRQQSHLWGHQIALVSFAQCQAFVSMAAACCFVCLMYHAQSFMQAHQCMQAAIIALQISKLLPSQPAWLPVCSLCFGCAD